MNEKRESESPPPKKQKIEDEISNSDNLDNDNEEDFSKDVDPTEENSMNEEKYTDFVTPEELEKLKEFKILDEVKSNDGDSNDDDSDDSDGKSDELPEEEIEKMLDENLPEDFKGTRKPKDKPYITRTKTFLEEKGVNQFEILPLDWMMIRHYSGMPLYMHRPTRVCTLAKPYFLGKGNTRRHDIPISAIPCLAYRRALEEEEKQKEIDRRVEEEIKNKTWLKVPTDSNENNAAENGSLPEIKPDNSNDDDEAPGGSGAGAPRGRCPFRHAIAASAQAPAGQGGGAPTLEAPLEGTESSAAASSSAASQTIVAASSPAVSQAIVAEAETPILGSIKEEGPSDEAPAGGAAPPAGRRPVLLPGGAVMPSPRVESVDTSWKTQHLTAEEINGYCKRLFKFKTVNFMHFNRWADRRKYTKARKALQYPKLPEGTKLITIPASTSGQENGGKAAKRDWVMNMNGCSYLSEFHEYVCRALQKQPVYEYKQLENAATPYQATVFIGGMQYGVGHGSSKRQAKYAAARASIQTLIPEMRDMLEPQERRPAEPDFSFFDYIGIEDPRIAEFCAATCEPSPHAILLTCLLRNFGAGDWQVHTEMKKLEYQKIELTMRVGKHSATVVCKNKKTAKQRASQAILQALHPHVRSWGSLLRLYGSRSVKSCKEKKLEEQQITLLQDKARRNEPNHAVLEKLRYEMRRLRERDAAVVPIGTVLLDAALPAHSASDLNNVDL